jgi:hypothetical protein
MPVFRLSLVALLAAVCGGPALAQPTYRLDVKRELKPAATLTLAADGKLTRSAVTDDPGFRLQLHFKKDGKSIATRDVRAETTVALPATEVGTYTVALELFHPAYKGGTASKGEFKAISEVLTYRIESQKPLKVVVVPPPPKPATPAPKAAPKPEAKKP